MRDGYKLWQFSADEGLGVELNPTDAPVGEDVVMELFNPGYADDAELQLLLPGASPVPVSLVLEFIAEGRRWLEPPVEE